MNVFTYIFASLHIYIYNIPLWLFFFLPCLPQMALSWGTCYHQGGRRKLALCLKQQFSGLESWIWVLLFRGAPTSCQPCDVGYFSPAVKTHLQCRWLSWTSSAASVLSHEYLQQESPVLLALPSHSTPITSPAPRPYTMDRPRGREIAFLWLDFQPELTQVRLHPKQCCNHWAVWFKHVCQN